MQDFLAKLHKKGPFSGVTFKYTKKYHFNIQHLIHFLKKLTILSFLGKCRTNFLAGWFIWDIIVLPIIKSGPGGAVSSNKT